MKILRQLDDMLPGQLVVDHELAEAGVIGGDHGSVVLQRRVVTGRRVGGSGRGRGHGG